MKLISLHKIVGYDWTLVVENAGAHYVLTYLFGQGWTVQAFSIPGATLWLSPSHLTAYFRLCLAMEVAREKGVNDFIAQNQESAHLTIPFWT